MSKLISGSKGGKGGGGGSRVAKEAPDSLISTQYAKVLDLVCEGEIEGLVDGLKSIYLNDTPIQNQDGSYNFHDIVVYSTIGTQTQEYIPGFPSIESVVSVGVKVQKNSPVVRQITDSTIDYVRVDISVPRLTSQNVTNGDINGAKVEYTIDIQDNGGGFVTVYNGVFSGKTTTQYTRSHEVLLSGSGPWDIRVTRVTDDSQTIAVQDEIYWTAYTKVIDSKFTFPNSAIIGLQVDAKQFNNIPSRAYDLKLLKVKVPESTHYDPINKTYTGVWNGYFELAWTDNPAWCFYDLVTNKRYGLGNYIDSSLLDKWHIYEIAKYCDELVPDGFGGMEPRFTCNLYLQTREEALTVIRNMASIFRAMLYWTTNGILAIQDKPANIIAQFNNSDVIEGVFNYSGSASKTRHTVALVSWNNPDNKYIQEVEYVEDSEGIKKYGYNETEIVAFGCTSRGQAHRIGKWLLYSEINETETISFSTYLEGAYISPGELIQTMDQYRSGTRYGGRILNSSSNTITLDNPVTLNASVSYEISVTMPNGSIETIGITNSPGTTDTINLSSPLSVLPEKHAVWVISGSDISPEIWRVLSVEETDAGLYNITAIEHNPSKFNFIEQNISLENPNTTYLDFSIQQPITSIHVEESLFQTSPGNNIPRLTVSWDKPENAVQYIVSYKVDNGNWIQTEVSTNTLDIDGIFSGTVTFNIKAKNLVGTKSSSYISYYTINGVQLGIDNVNNFTAQLNNGICTLSWDPVTTSTLDHYIIKYNNNDLLNTTWSSSTIAYSNINKNTTTIQVPSNSGTFLIKAVDYYGNESIDATKVNISSNSNYWYNIATITESPVFDGQHTNTVVDNNKLTIVDKTLDGVYYFNSATDTSSYDTGKVYSILPVANITAFADDGIPISNWNLLSDVALLNNIIDKNWSVYIEIRYTDDDPTSSNPLWSQWEPLVTKEYIARAFDFRLIINSVDNNAKPYISEVSIDILAKERTEVGSNISSGTAVKNIAYTNPFISIPVINITPHNMLSGDFYQITNKTINGFDIVFKDSTNTIVDRAFDYTVTGY